MRGRKIATLFLVALLFLSGCTLFEDLEDKEAIVPTTLIELKNEGGNLIFAFADTKQRIYSNRGETLRYKLVLDDTIKKPTITYTKTYMQRDMTEEEAQKSSWEDAQRSDLTITISSETYYTLFGETEVDLSTFSAK